MKYAIEDTTLTAIGDAVRAKSGSNDLIKVSKLADAITNLSTLPDEALVLTGNCSYKFYRGNWTWLIEQYGNLIRTENISSLDEAFYYNLGVKRLPFELNMDPTSNSSATIGNAFNYSGLEEAPVINNLKFTAIPAELFAFCYYMRTMPEDFSSNWVGNLSQTIGSSKRRAFYNCFSLRRVSPTFIKNFWDGDGSIYYEYFSGCYVLDEIKGLAVAIPRDGNNITSNKFNSTFNGCSRLKDLTFEMNEDSTPKTVQWKSQTINLTVYFGYAYRESSVLNYNTGITADKQVKDDATYQALKDDPDWWTLNINYSRYNHDSAVATINSLPDTSAYLAANGGTNTITFIGNAGSRTDGGAINTLTEEEIAVATAKGWTVSLS